MINRISEEQINQAFKKLKSHLFSDKTLLYEKIELARFESNLPNKITNLCRSINKNQIQEWVNTIDYTLVPKKLKNIDNLPTNIYSNKTKNDKYEVESYNIFIKAPIEVHLISTLWTMFIGEQLDKELIDETKGNRLYRDKNGNFKNDSYKLFKPYYEGYQSFRDEAIDMAISLHEKKLNVTFVNLDIQEFYYNINFDFINDLPSDIHNMYKLNNFMQKIHEKFHNIIAENNLQPKTDNIYDRKKFLPIGLVSSSVVANYVLKDFDNDIVKNLQPAYYSRYVDDMLLVFSGGSVDLSSDTIICDLLKCETIDTKFYCEDCDDSVSFKTKNRDFKLQKEKVKIFQFEKNDSIIVLEKFQETIDKNSSFFNFMPDDEKLFKTLESSGNILFYSNSENKISSLVGTVKDTLSISRNLTGVISTASSSNFDKNHFDDYNKQLQNVFSGKNIFELRLHWEKVFEYLFIVNDNILFKKFVAYFLDSISKLKHDDNEQQIKLQRDTKKYLLYSVKFSRASKKTSSSKSTKLIRDKNMFSHHNMSYPLLNFCENVDNINFLTHDIDLRNFNFMIEQSKIYNSPRFIHYHEIALFYFLNNLNISFSKEHNYNQNYSLFLNEKYRDFNDFKDKNIINFPNFKESTFIVESNGKDMEKKDKLKIAIVSIKVDTKDIEASYLNKANLSYKRLQNLFDILNESIRKQEHKPDMIIFPEVSIPYAWIHFFSRFSKKNDVGIIFGVEHIKIGTEVSNYTCVMLPFKIDGHLNLFINFDLKRHYAPKEQMGIEGHKFTINENKKQPILYKWRNSVFTSFNCYELSDITLRSQLVGKVDFIIAIEHNHDTNYFSNIIESISRDIHCYVIQVNTSNYGDSRIVQPTKTERKNIVKIKGGQNLYLVIDDIDIKSLREFQAKNHCLQIQEKDSFKLTPPKFNIDILRE